MPYRNKVRIAAAGAGKTSRIAREAITVDPSERVLITTFTLNNVSEIKSAICRENGIQPTNITVLPWFTFVLHELARPYQNHFFRPRRIKSLNLVNGRSDRYAPKADKDRYFLVEEQMYIQISFPSWLFSAMNIPMAGCSLALNIFATICSLMKYRI